MNSVYSQAQAVDYSEQACLDANPLATSKSTTIASELSPPESETDSCQSHPSLRMCVSSYSLVQPNSTEELRTWLLAAFPVRRIRRPVMEDEPQETGGLKCLRLSASLSRTAFLPRTCRGQQLTLPLLTLGKSDTIQSKSLCQRRTWVQTMYGNDIGYLHTPTATANYAAPSMQKWESCRNFVQVFGQPTPTNQEWMMGWPIGWTDLKPLATDKCQSAQQLPFSYWLEVNLEAIEAWKTHLGINTNGAQESEWIQPRILRTEQGNHSQAENGIDA